MYQVILNKIKRDPDYPSRQYPLMIFKKILDGSLYDCFGYQYHEEYLMNGTQYVAEHERAPCINSGLNLMRSVVEQSVSFLFGEDRFPSVVCTDENTKTFIDNVVRDTGLVRVMQTAATRGSIGSSAIFLKVSKGRFFPRPFDTLFLTPKYDEDEPDVLVSMTEKRKVLGRDLAEAGYEIDDKDLDNKYWFHRVWDTNDEIWYVPYEVGTDKSDKFRLVVDTKRSKTHGLGEVPWIWMPNLVGTDESVDGRCTFEPGIECCVQIDYLLSRADRALKYNSDPLTVFKLRNPDAIAGMVKDSGNAIVLPVEGSAELLEVSGNATAAILDFVERLRSEALESMHGSRANPDKLATSNSSVAQRMLYLPMVGLAAHLRVSYGEFGILPLIRLMMRIANKGGIKVLGKYAKNIDPLADISLMWQDFFPKTPFDVNLEVQSFGVGVEGGFISRELALENLKKFIDVPDVDLAMEQIKSDQKAVSDQEIALETAKAKAKPVPKPVRPVSKTTSVSRS